MRTHRLGSLAINPQHLAQDIAVFETLPHSTAYSDYLCNGPWLSCALWAKGGAIKDGLIEKLPERAPGAWTAAGLQLPALRELIEGAVCHEALTSVRLAMIMPGSLIIPHRDLLELSAPVHRFHVPLRTDDESLFAEGDAVYRMRHGELWALDASDEHSVICNSAVPRIHLILDFPDIALAEMMRMPVRPAEGIPRDALVDRPPLKPTEHAALLGLAGVVTLANLRTVIELVTRQLYNRAVPVSYVWDTLCAIADKAPDRAAARRLLELNRYYCLNRTSGRVPDLVTA
jgi:L-proline cis-4-hydroxylase